MYVSHLECPRCTQIYDYGKRIQICTCGSPLLVRYDLDRVAAALNKNEMCGRPASLWRYRELLPVSDDAHIVSLGEGLTPLVRAPQLGHRFGFKNLFIKDEGIIPTGTFKARGAAVGVSCAREAGVDTLAMPTNGNAGGAWAAYCAAAGIRCVIVMPRDAPLINTKEIAVTGADLFLVDGLISDAGRIVGRAVAQHGWFDASTLKEPFRIEGKKTMGYEIAEQMGWRVPDVIIYPTGGGVGIIGIFKAIQELQAMGWIGPKMPRLVAVQASGCAPIVSAYEARARTSEFWEGAATCAFGITVPKALGDFLVLEAVYASHGCAVAVTDDAILDAQAQIAMAEGNFVCPEGAATFAAARQLLAQGWIQPEEEVVLLNTGTGLKYPQTVEAEPVLLSPGDDLPV